MSVTVTETSTTFFRIMPSRLTQTCLPLLGLCATLCWGSAPALAAADKALVSNVRFATLRPPDGSTDNWLEMAVEIDAQPAANTTGRVTGRVRVTAMLGYERPAPGNTRQWQFFRAQAELVGLVSGRTHVRFYLPPEIVRRDALAGAPGYWDVTVTGESLESETVIGRRSPTLEADEVYRGFRDKVASEGTANDGVMQPQYLTPFREAYPRATPTFVRREAWR